MFCLCSVIRPEPPRPSDKLQAITIYQPFASAIMALTKRVENRTWGSKELKELMPGARWPSITYCSMFCSFCCARRLSFHSLSPHPPVAAHFAPLPGASGRGGLSLPNGGRNVWLVLHAGKVAASEEKYGEHLSLLRAAWPDMPPISTLPKSAILGYFHVSDVLASIPDDPQAIGHASWSRPLNPWIWLPCLPCLVLTQRPPDRHHPSQPAVLAH